MPALFPGSVRIFTPKVDLVDTVMASHVNLLQDEVTAVQSTIGTGALSSSWAGAYTNPATHTSVSARLENIEAGVKSAVGTLTGLSGTVVGTTATQTLTNKTLINPVISQISNTGTLTLPTSTDTLVGRDTTDTLTNKTLTSPTVNGATLSGTLTSTATMTGGTVNPTTLQQGGVAAVTVSGTQVLTNKTLTAPTVTSPVVTVATTATAGSYTLVLSDASKTIEISSGSANTLTIPVESSVNFPVGTQIIVLQTGAGQTTVAGASGVTLNGTPGLKLRTQWSLATLIKRGSNNWVVAGDVVA
jgi:hypothetical protein